MKWESNRGKCIPFLSSLQVKPTPTQSDQTPLFTVGRETDTYSMLTGTLESMKITYKKNSSAANGVKNGGKKNGGKKAGKKAAPKTP